MRPATITNKRKRDESIHLVEGRQISRTLLHRDPFIFSEENLFVQVQKFPPFEDTHKILLREHLRLRTKEESFPTFTTVDSVDPIAVVAESFPPFDEDSGEANRSGADCLDSFLDAVHAVSTRLLLHFAVDARVHLATLLQALRRAYKTEENFQ